MRQRALQAFLQFLLGIICGYVAAFIMGFVLPTTGVTADGVEYTKGMGIKLAEGSRRVLVCNSDIDAGKASI